MDFVTKKALEAKVKNVGKELGLASGSSSQRDPTWSIFRTQDRESNPEPTFEESTPENDTFPYDVANFYDNCPRNFPFCLRLFYVDRSILSQAAISPVNWTFRTYLLFQLLLLYNTAMAITFAALDKGSSWPNIVISASITFVLSVIQLFAFEVSFRGAYRTSKTLRQRYLAFGTANIIIIGLYACLSYSLFNGWQEISRLRHMSNLKLKSLRIVLVVAETLGWTILLFVNTFTLFEYYHLMRGKHQGLSEEALAAASSATTEQPTVQREAPRHRDPERERQMRDIRNKYQTDFT